MRQAMYLSSAVLLLLALPASALMKYTGHYTGTLLYDRWGTCILHDASTLNYISEAAKETLRPYTGKQVVIDVTKSESPWGNESRFTEFTYVGPAPEQQPDNPLKVHTRLTAKEGEPPAFQIDIQNTATTPYTASRISLIPTLMAKTLPRDIGSSISDGPSHAALLSSFAPLGDWAGAREMDRPTAQGYLWCINGAQNGTKVSARVPDDPRLHLPITLAPGETLSVTLEFSLFPGEYDLLCSLSVHTKDGDSPARGTFTAFDVDPAGNVLPVPLKNR